jgi:endonuclease/exonuclease/phosphatase (EEP) superfamily protein YafD
MSNAPAATRKQRVVKRLVMLTVLLTVATVCAACANFYWFLELFTHFVPWYTGFALLLAAGQAFAREWRWASVAAALTLWHGFALVSYLMPGSGPPAGNGRLTVFHYNAYLHHNEPHRISAYLRREKAVDVVVLLEASPRFGGVLAALKETHPYQITSLEDSPFGIAVASRVPIDYGAISRQPAGYPWIELTLKLPGRTVPMALYAIHPPPPVNAELAAARDETMMFIAGKVAAQPAATPIVVGDFNVTPWSPAFTRFEKVSGLKPAHAPWRMDNTWPVTFNNANLGIAIDHSFAHPSLTLITRVVGPDLGSDHMPVTVTYAY